MHLLFLVLTSVVFAGTDQPLSGTGSAGTVGTMGSAGTKGSKGTAGTAGSVGTAGTVGEVGQLPWEVPSSDLGAMTSVPIWLDLSRRGGARFVPRGLPPLLVGPVMVEVQGLDLRGQTVSAELAKALAASQTLSSLQVLRLGNTQLNDTGLRALAYSSAFPALLFVDLSGNPTTEHAMSELAQARWLAQVHHLDLRNTTAPGVEAARALGRNLKAIEILQVDPSWPPEVLAALRDGLGDRVSALHPP
jgi:hypothetical protein